MYLPPRLRENGSYFDWNIIFENKYKLNKKSENIDYLSKKF